MRTSASVLTCWIWTCSESMMLFALALDAWSAASRSSSSAALASSFATTVRHDGIAVFGRNPPVSPEALNRDWVTLRANTEMRERQRAKNVHRTFTQVGFDSAPIPDPVCNRL